MNEVEKKDLVQKLTKHGVKKNVELLIDIYDSSVVAEFMKNPYILIYAGYTISEADHVAFSMGVKNDFEGRLTAIIMFVLLKNERDGHTCMPIELFSKVIREYALSRSILEKIQKTIYKLEKEYLITTYNNSVYRDITYSSEYFSAIKLSELVEPLNEIDHLESFIKRAEDDLKISLHEEQKNAVKMALSNRISILTGGPGTGKTHVLRILKHIYDTLDNNKVMVFTAPTGRAARRITESTGYAAGTIQGYLEMKHCNERDLIDHSLDLSNVYIVCDESSMIDIWIFARLIDSLDSSCRLLLVGDADQLPSVGPGTILFSLIKSKRLPITNLTHIFRQSQESNIAANTLKIRAENTSLDFGLGFFFYQTHSIEETADMMIDSFLQAVSRYGLDGVCCLSIYKEYSAISAKALNSKIQKQLKSSGKSIIFNECEYYVGDRVMHLENNRGLYNGSIGYVTEVYEDTLVVKYDNLEIIYKKKELSEIMLSYALTVHKSQGSEFDAIIFSLMDEYSNKLMNYNMFLTAASRAKQQFNLFGTETAVLSAIRNRTATLRHSNLCEMVSEHINEKATPAIMTGVAFSE